MNRGKPPLEACLYYYFNGVHFPTRPMPVKVEWCSLATLFDAQEEGSQDGLRRRLMSPSSRPIGHRLLLCGAELASTGQDSAPPRALPSM